VAVSLTACSPAQNNASGCVGPVTSGEASNLINVTGQLGQPPVIDIPTPLKTSQTQRTIISEGTGPGLIKGQLIDVDFTFVDGTTGQVQQQNGYATGETPSAIVLNDQTLPGVVNGLLCAQRGSRVAIAIASSDLTAQQGVQSTNDTVIAVIDVINAYPVKANGTNQPAQPGFPEVVTDEYGTPGVVLPAVTPPTELMITDIKKGNGAVVEENNTVIVQYTGILWDQKTVFDSTWESGTPASFPAGPNQGLIPGFSEALVGHTVGSQVIAVIPPDLGYGTKGIPQAGIPGNATLIFVVDILGTA
jgi:FKBP-type peptidyl-prolyl cis-trans isomerase